jgi:MFS family permease
MSLLLALTFGQQLGFSATPILTLFGVSAIVLVIFLAIEWKTNQPMIDLQLFRKKLISVNLLKAVLVFVAVTGGIFLMPFYLENIKGYDTRQVGLLLAVVPVMLGIAAPISGSLSDRFGTQIIATIGLAMMVLGMYLLTSLDENTTTIGYILRFVPIGIGSGIFQSPNNSAIMGSAPPSQLGVVSGLLSISRVLGQTIGFAVMGALWASSAAFHAGVRLEGGVTSAPISAQIAGLHDTFIIMTILMSLALALSLWSVAWERQGVKPVVHRSATDSAVE